MIFFFMKKVVKTGQYESEWLIENLWPFLRFSGGLRYKIKDTGKILT